MSLSGTALTFASAEAALAEGLRAIESGRNEFNLAGMASVDSAGVAVLLAWQRAAQLQGVRLRLLNPPSGLLSLAELYGVSELLSFAEADRA